MNPIGEERHSQSEPDLQQEFSSNNFLEQFSNFQHESENAMYTGEQRPHPARSTGTSVLDTLVKLGYDVEAADPLSIHPHMPLNH